MRVKLAAVFLVVLAKLLEGDIGSWINEHSVFGRLTAVFESAASAADRNGLNPH